MIIQYTEAELRSILVNASGTACDIWCADYDGDGYLEAFAVAGWNDSELWYCNGARAWKVAASQGIGYEVDGCESYDICSTGGEITGIYYHSNGIVNINYHLNSRNCNATLIIDGSVASIISDSSGSYSISSLPLGNYTVVMECTGYTTAHFNIAVTRYYNLNWHGVLNPNGQSSYESGDMRIILTWGESPRDLDSHLRGPGVNGSSFHTYFGSKTYDYNGVRRAFLDVDDTSFYGPETTTVYSMSSSGIYSFYVHDYANREQVNSSCLANSGARVQVYMGDRQIAEYHVPGSGKGNVWHVFNFDAKNGKLIPVNSFSNCANAGIVGQ